MRNLRGTITSVAAGVLLAGAAVAVAATPTPTPTPTPAEQTRLWDEVGRVARKGPIDVPLFDQAVLHLPAGEIFVPQPQADRLLELFGNPGANPDMPGLILPRDPKATWFMPVRFRATGYIKDDDARTWNADDMLASLKTGTDEQNRERQRSGIPQMRIVDWSERPRYDPATQRLVWALISSVVDAKPGQPPIVNYNTYALGREGYFTMNMVAGAADLAKLKPVAEQQLAALDYNAGKHYAEFDARTDRVAFSGLASLVVSIAQPRLGLIPGANAFTTALLKYVVPAGLVLLVLGVVFMRRKPRRIVEAPAATPFVATVADAPIGSGPVLDLDLDNDRAGTDASHRVA